MPDILPPSQSTQEQDDMATNWAVNGIWNSKHIPWLIDSLKKKEPIMIVSDGSFHPEHEMGTAGWFITTKKDYSKMVIGDNIVPGDAQSQCSHRSELSGLIGAVKHISYLCRLHGITDGDIEIGCDGLQAFRAATRHTWKSTTSISHFDLVTTLHSLIRATPLTITFRHVKGHQDKHKKFKDCDIWEQMNQLTDVHAKQVMKSYLSQGGTNYQTAYPQAALGAIKITTKGKTFHLVSKLRESLQQHLAYESDELLATQGEKGGGPQL